MKTLDDRFWAKVAPAEADECWLWTGAKWPRGYGQFHTGLRKSVSRAHRVAWELLRGEIPDGLELDHLCRTPSCVNPWHLEPVTGKVNRSRVDWTARKASTRRPRRPVQRRQKPPPAYCRNGHAYDEQNTYLWRDRYYCRACTRAAVTRYQAKKRGAA